MEESMTERYRDYMARKTREDKQQRELFKEEEIITKPSHYTRYPIQPISFIMRNNMEFWRGNIIKYATRAGYKNYANMTGPESEVADLKKVIRYSEIRINQLNGKVEL